MLCLLALCGGLWQPAAAASVQFQEIPVEFTFGGDIAFGVQIQADADIQSAMLFYRYEGLPETYQAQASLSEDSRASYVLDTRQTWPPAFAQVTYWFAISLADGSTANSPEYTFAYFDDRFNWQTTQETFPLNIHRYDEDPAFGLTLLETSRLGLEKINRLIAAAPTESIDIYIYENALDMQSTLRLGNVRWVAGHADPWLGVIVVALPPGPNRLELTRQRIPHELMHIVLYQKIGSGYQNLPTWFNEGLASLAELENNPDYYTILRKAHEQDLTLPLAGLCESFPQEASNAFLAYAQAEVFTRYLYEQFGAQKMQALIEVYADGLACERGPEVVLGKSLNQLEAEWRGMLFGENILAAGLRDVLPWLALLLAALFSPLLLLIIGPNKRRKNA